MKVYIDTKVDFAIMRIAKALKQYAPPSIKFVNTEAEADLVIIFAHGQRRSVWWHTARLTAAGKEYVIVQLALRSTTNPNTGDWLKIWTGAELIWSYYDLPKLMKEDGIDLWQQYIVKCYQSPLGVDTNLFKEIPTERIYTIFKGFHRNETIHQIDEACRIAKKTCVATEGVSDEELAITYNQCKYVSGLRKIEGFEMPVIEGLLCGARPICYDRPHYRKWFGDLVEYIPESGKAEIIYAITELLMKEPRPVTEAEKRLVREKFNWSTIIKEFWKRL